MNNFLKKYWLKITDKPKHEEIKILKRSEEEKKIFQNKFEYQINNFHKKIESNQLVYYMNYFAVLRNL